MANITVTTSGGATSLVSIGSRGPAGPAGTGAAGVTNVATGTGLTGGPITTTGTIALATTAVTAGVYQAPFVQVDAQGRLTKALDEPCDDQISFSGSASGNPNNLLTATGIIEWATPRVSAVARTGIFAGIATSTDILLIDPYTFSSTVAVEFLRVTGGGFTHAFNIVKSEIIVQSSTEIITRLTGSVTNFGGTALPTRPAIAIFRYLSDLTFTITLKVQKEFLYTGTSPVVVTGRAISLAASAAAGTYASPSSITVDATGRVTSATAGAGSSVTGTAPIVVTSGVVSLATTLPSAYAFSSTTRPTSAATTNTLAAADAQSLITKGDADARFWQPDRISGLTARFTAENLLVQGSATPSDGSAITTWRTSQGNLTVTQATAGRRPTFRTNIQNGLPAVLFDGVDDALASASSFSIYVSSNQRTVFTVARPTALVAVGTGNTYGRPQIWCAANGFNGLSVSPSGSNNIFNVWDYDASSSVSASTASAAVNSNILLTTRHLAGVTSISLNQGTPVTNSTLRDASTNNVLVFGNDGVSGTLPYTGYIFEILFYNRALSNEEIAAVEAFLKTKWGI